jgi:hypothetical protein
MAAVLNCLPADTQFLWDTAWVNRALVAHWLTPVLRESRTSVEEQLSNDRQARASFLHVLIYTKHT